MGVVVNYTRLSTEELREALYFDAGECWEFVAGLDRTGEPDGYLDKSWGGICYLLAVSGAEFDPMESEGEFPCGELFYQTPATVERIARQLRDIPFTELAEFCDFDLMRAADVYPAGLWRPDNQALEYLEENYARLSRFFAYAAESGSATAMSCS